jgi:hypothetical protein
MSTSGTYTFNYARDQIIRLALRKIGVIQAGEVPSAQLTNDCADQLNAMVKQWAAQGIHVWTTTEAIMLTNVGQAVYPLGTGTPTQAYSVLAEPLISAACAFGAVVVPLNNTFNISVGSTVGIVLDSGAVQWTTVSAVSTNLSITIPSPGLTDSTSLDNVVYVTGGQIIRPLRVWSARRWNILSQEETPMYPMSRNDYNTLPNKYSTGTPTQFFYDPQGGANTNGNLYIWPTAADTITGNLKFTFDRPLQDFDTAANTPDFPQEWINCLSWNLALMMAPEFGVPTGVYTMVKEQAMLALDECKGWDREPESYFFGVDFMRMGS